MLAWETVFVPLVGPPAPEGGGMTDGFTQATSFAVGGVNAIVGSGCGEPGAEVAVHGNVKSFDASFVKIAIEVPARDVVGFVFVCQVYLVFVDHVLMSLMYPLKENVKVFPGVLDVDVVVVGFLRFQVRLPTVTAPRFS